MTTASTLVREALAPAARWRGAVALDIGGLGVALPHRVVTNGELADRLDTSDHWIRSRTGIAVRHVAGAGETTTSLAAAAARAAVADAGVDPARLGAVVVATSTPDSNIPGVAPQVAAALGSGAFAFDVNAACAGFVAALATGAGLVATSGAPVVVVGADVMTAAVDARDRSTAVLFGDGAGAVVLAPSQHGGLIGPFDGGSDGSLRDLLLVPPGEPHLRMRGREVYRHAVARMAASSQAVLRAADLMPIEVDLIVAHQANRRILDAVAGRLGVAEDHMHVAVDRHGNTSAASIPLALADARDAGRLEPGATVLVTAFGAGFTWGSALLRWPDVDVDGVRHG